MTKTIITIINGRKIIKREDKHNTPRYVIQEGHRYLGKTKDGGYTNLSSAKKRAAA